MSTAAQRRIRRLRIGHQVVQDPLQPRFFDRLRGVTWRSWLEYIRIVIGRRHAARVQLGCGTAETRSAVEKLCRQKLRRADKQRGCQNRLDAKRAQPPDATHNAQCPDAKAILNAMGELKRSRSVLSSLKPD